MKKHYLDVIEPLSRLSEIPWDPNTGVGFTLDTPASVRGVWQTYVTVCIVKISHFLYAFTSKQNHKSAWPYENGYSLFNSLQILVPSDAKGQKAYHSCLGPQSAAIETNDANASDDGDLENLDNEQGVNEASHEGANTSGGSGTVVGAVSSGDGGSHSLVVGPQATAGAEGVAALAHDGSDSGDSGNRGLSDGDGHPTPPPSSLSVISKCSFSAVDSTVNSSTLPPSASQVPLSLTVLCDTSSS